MRSAKTPGSISLVVPVFNEEGRVHNLGKLWSFMKGKRHIKELIVVNDGSTDKTLPLLRALQKKIKYKLISYRKNKGKGFAIGKGVEAAKGYWVVFMDVDMSTPPLMLGELKRVMHLADVTVGTRKSVHATLTRRQPKVRETMGMLFTLISRQMTGVAVSDFTCGFKCFSKKAAKKIFKEQRIERWAFDAETLFLAKKYGFSIQELPVEWRDVKGTKVRFPQDAIRSLLDLISIRINDALGKY